MSSRRKISVELPKRPSVFERLGTKPGMPQPKLKQSSRPKTNKPGKEKHAEKELPSADDRLLPKKAPVVKEPEKIPKDLKKKRVKRPRSRSSSSSSSSSGSSSSSSSSSDSSSSSEDEQRRKRSRKRRRSGESRRRGGASRDKSRSPQRKRRDKKRLPPAKKVASKKVPSSPARSKASSVPAKKRRSNSGKGKGQQSGARASVRRSTSRGRKRSRSRDGKPTGGQRHHSVSPKVRSRSPRRGSPGGGGGGGPRKRTPSPRRRASRSPMRASVGSGARRDGSRRRSVERGRQARSPARQLGGFDRRAVSTSRERVGGDRKDRRSLPRSNKQLDPPGRAAQVERVWEEPARLKDEDVRRRRDDLRDRQWPARPPSDYGREPLPYEEVPLLPPRRFSPGPVRGDGRRPPLLAPPCGDDRLQRPPPYGRHGPDERRSMDRLLPPRADEWMPYDDGAPPIPPPPPPPPAVGRGMPRGGRDWSSPGRGPSFRRGAEPWGGPMPRMNRGGFRRGGGGGGGFHGGAGGGGGGPSYYDPESELEPPPDPGDMIVRDEVRSEEGGSGPEDETASPAADRRSEFDYEDKETRCWSLRRDVVPESSRTSREPEPPQPPDVWSGGKEPWTSKVGPSGEPEAGGGAAVPAAGSEPAPAAAAAEPAPVPELNLQAESLSDFSDDADEILNREDEVVEEEITFEDDSGQDGERAGSPGSGSARLTSGEQLPPPPPREMSSGEAEPEPAEPPEPKPQSLVDALAIDWSSLVSSRPLRAASPPAGAALERFSPAVVFAQLGVCSEWAGPQLVQRVAQACSNGTDAVVTPPEPVPGEEELQRRYLKKGEQMLSDPGPYRRALCTKADLAIRRHLCEVTETEPLTGAAAAATFKRDTFTKHLALLTARVG